MTGKPLSLTLLTVGIRFSTGVGPIRVSTSGRRSGSGGDTGGFFGLIAFIWGLVAVVLAFIWPLLVGGGWIGETLWLVALLALAVGFVMWRRKRRAARAALEAEYSRRYPGITERQRADAIDRERQAAKLERKAARRR